MVRINQNIKYKLQFLQWQIHVYMEESPFQWISHQFKLLTGPSEPLFFNNFPESKSKKDQETFDYIKLINILNTFHKVAKQLNRRHSNRSTLKIMDEYDVQDLLHSLLKIHFSDIREEEWTPSYAGKSARMDFILKDQGIVIEVKKTRLGLSDKEIGDQLIIDKERYKNYKDYTTLICFIYDPEGFISNPQGLIKDLSSDEGNIKVEVIINPSL